MYCDVHILWYSVVYYGILWYTMLYSGILWYTVNTTVYNGILCGICTVLWFSTMVQYRFLLGMFDPPSIQPYWNISVDQVNTAQHQVWPHSQDKNTMAPNTGNLLAQIYLRCILARIPSAVYQHEDIFGKNNRSRGRWTSRQSPGV